MSEQNQFQQNEPPIQPSIIQSQKSLQKRPYPMRIFAAIVLLLLLAAGGIFLWRSDGFIFFWQKPKEEKGATTENVKEMEDDKNTEFVTYTDPEGHFSFLVPAYYTVINDEGETVFLNVRSKISRNTVANVDYPGDELLKAVGQHLDNGGACGENLIMMTLPPLAGHRDYISNHPSKDMNIEQLQDAVMEEGEDFEPQRIKTVSGEALYLRGKDLHIERQKDWGATRCQVACAEGGSIYFFENNKIAYSNLSADDIIECYSAKPLDSQEDMRKPSPWLDELNLRHAQNTDVPELIKSFRFPK